MSRLLPTRSVLLPLEVTWAVVESRLLTLAQAAVPPARVAADAVLERFGLTANGELTDFGERYYEARYVRDDKLATRHLMAEALTHDPTVNALCEAVWRVGEIPKAGALNMLRRLERGVELDQLTRLLEQMGRAGLIVYNRRNPTVRAAFNPGQLTSPEEEAARERASGHVIAPETPFGNLMALRGMLRSARSYIYWYEQHMAPKVLEVLYREVDGSGISEIRLLSGPTHIDRSARSDFRRFREEMSAQRGVSANWRVLARSEAARHHGRFFLSDGLARNLPPLNLILKGSTDEILTSEVGVTEFNTWWCHATDIFDPSLALTAAA
jgi:hypothetical protein